MTTYIVVGDGSDIRDRLLEACSKVGKPGPLGKIYIVESDAPIHILKSIPGVEDVEEDGDVEPDEDPLPPEVKVQENPDNWFLKTLAQDRSDYCYTRTGKGVDLYIIDSGIWPHEEFEDRIVNLWAFDNKAYGEDVRSHHHGTMCAGCAGGKVHGVAKEVTLVNLRTNWTSSDTLKAMDNVLKHHLEKPNDRGSVLSMSFSSTSSYAYRYAIGELIDNGVVCLASTGNNREDAARYPAGNDEVLGIACMGHVSGDPMRLQPASYTNYGDRTDMWAPGHNGTVAGYNKEVQNANGTSAACPVAAGVMAMYLEGSAKLTSRKEVLDAITGFFSNCLTTVDLSGQYKNTTPLIVTTLFNNAIFKPFPEPEPEPIPTPEPEPTPEPVPEPTPPKENKKEKAIKKYLPAILGVVAVGIIVYLIAA